MDNKIKEVITQLIKQHTPMQVIAAKVVSVDEENATCDCDPADGGPTLHDVRLRSSIDGIQEGIIPIPNDGSYILVGLINNNINHTYVVSFTSLRKITIKCDDIQLNGDSKGSLPVIQSLVEKINQLEQKLSNHQHVYVDGPGTGPQITVTSPNPATSQLIDQLTTVSDLENPKVKHG